jgi:glycosyltransferase involved in cell wall biosynthesis
MSPTPSRRLDVCLASYRFHPVYAGPAIRFKRYAPDLRKRGVDLRVFSGDFETVPVAGERPLEHGELLAPDAVDGIPVQRVHLSKGGSKRRLFTFYRELARHCAEGPGRPDVVQLLTVSTWASLWFRRLRRMGIPLVYTATMMPTSELPWYKRRFDRISTRWLDCIVVSTGVMRDAMGGDRSRVRLEVIPNGLDLERFRLLCDEEERCGVRRRLELDADAELVVFVGGFLNRRKGIDVLAEAWGHIASARPRARLVLVGMHVNELRPAGPQNAFLEGVRRSLAEAAGGLDRVTFTGPVDNVEEYLQVADVFVFPSRREGMPNVVPEAFGCGAASVLTPFEGLPEEFGRPGEHYVLSPRTPTDLAGAVTVLLASPDRRAALSRSARRWVEDNLDVARSLDRYADLYRELAERTGTTG